jgi:hypothetical protein
MLGKGIRRTKIRLLMAAALLGMAAVITASIAAPAALAKTHHPGHSRIDSMRVHPGPRTGDPFTWKNITDGMCLGIAANAYEGDAVQWKCNGSTNQDWAWGGELGSTGFYQIVNGNNSCLGLAGGDHSNGTQVVGWQCYGTHDDQYWTWFDDAGLCTTQSGDTITYYFPIIDYLDNTNTGGEEVVGVSGGSTSEGAKLVGYELNGDCNNQWWTDGYSVVITTHKP